MFLSLAFPALALTVPVSAILTDEINANGTEGFRQTVTGTVAVSNPATGAVYTVGTDELTVNKREASGRGEMSFAGDPAGTIRTWALYYLDANGEVLGDPEVVDMLFDDSGNGAIAARDGVTGAVIALKVGAGIYGNSVSIQVQDSGVDATLIGIIELAHEGPALATDADMTVLDVNTFAAFQELGLDAVVALDSRSITLQGDVSVTGLSVASNGTVEGGADLRWDVTLYDPTVTGGCMLKWCDAPTLIPLATVSYVEAIGAVKKKSGQPAAVKLQPADVTDDSWDLAMGILMDGDFRDLAIGASLDFLGVTGSDIVTLDPGGFGVTWEADTCGQGRHWCVEQGVGSCHDDHIVDIFQDGDCEECGDYDFVNPEDPPAWVFLADEFIEVAVYDSAGGFVASHICTISPTAATLAGTNENDTLVGECTRDMAGTEVRRFKITTNGWDTSVEGARTVVFDVEMAGAAFTGERTAGECTKLGGCATGRVSVLGGTIALSSDGVEVHRAPIAVEETEFHLPFSFASDVSGMTGDLVLDFADSTQELTWVAYDDGIRGYAGDVLVREIGFADVDVVRNQKQFRCGAFSATGSVMTTQCTTHR